MARRHTPDGTIVSPIFKNARGIDEILGSYRSLCATFPDWQYFGQQVLVDGNRVAQPFRVRATTSRISWRSRVRASFDIGRVRVFEMKDG